MNKFIVTADGYLKFGDVALHKHLLGPGEACIGGGLYEFDYLSGRMLLSGRSYDFGRVKWGCIDALIIPESLGDMEVMYEDLPVTDFVPVRRLGRKDGEGI